MMIIRLLKYLDEGNDFSDKAVQLNLDLSEFMAQHYKNELINRGYIQKAETMDCSSACASCPSKCSSAGVVGTQMVMWEITDKGLNLIKKNR